MRGRLKGGVTALVALVALGAGGVAIAGATGGEDDGSGTPIQGSALDRAKGVALDRTGGGRVTATEVRDEEGYYEIEVKRDDGSSVDVHLDRDFNVLDADADGAGSGDEGSKED